MIGPTSSWSTARAARTRRSSASSGPLPVDDVLEVGIKIGEALHAAHQVGIVHRDVKPSNILRSRFGPALTDFGIARAPDELGSTLTREMMTPHHASPEALLHQAQSGLSDIYSLASTMWTLLVGHPPFVDPAQPPADMYAFRDRVLHDPLPPMTREDVPRLAASASSPRRWRSCPPNATRSAFEFAEALRRGALGLSPSPARRRSRHPRSRRHESHVLRRAVPGVAGPAAGPAAVAAPTPPPPSSPPPAPAPCPRRCRRRPSAPPPASASAAAPAPRRPGSSASAPRAVAAPVAAARPAGLDPDPAPPTQPSRGSSGPGIEEDEGGSAGPEAGGAGRGAMARAPTRGRA